MFSDICLVYLKSVSKCNGHTVYTWLSTTAGSISGISMTRSFPAPPVITAIFISWICKKKHGARDCARMARTINHAVLVKNCWKAKLHDLTSHHNTESNHECTTFLPFVMHYDPHLELLFTVSPWGTNTCEENKFDPTLHPCFAQGNGWLLQLDDCCYTAWSQQ